MSQGHPFTPELRNKIKQAIRNGEVPEIPTTINGKKIETPVKQVISGKDVKPSATVQNPEALEYFKRFRQIESEPKEARL